MAPIAIDQPKALDIPEILSNVLSFVDPSTLFVAIQVNSLWANEANRWLWRGKNRGVPTNFSWPLQKLKESCEDPERINWYTRKIRILRLSSEGASNALGHIADLLIARRFVFPLLKSVVIDLGIGDMNEGLMSQFLCRTLVRLELHGGYYDDWFLNQIQVHAPALRFFSVDNDVNHTDPNTAITPSSFLQFLGSMQSITHFELSHGWREVMNEDFWHHITHRANLEYLDVYHIESPVWDTICSLEPGGLPERIFPALRFLSMTADIETFQFLLSKLPTLEGICFNVRDPRRDHASSIHAFRMLASCPLLQEAEMWDTGPLSASDLLAVSTHCPLLRCLHIMGSFCEDSISSTLFDTLTCKWGLLTSLNLPISVEMSTSSFTYLARRCPHLWSLALSCTVNLEQLANFPDAVPFPCLETLRLRNVLRPSQQAMEEIPRRRKPGPQSWLSRMLRRWFPTLAEVDLFVSEDSNLSLQLTRAANRCIDLSTEGIVNQFHLRSLYVERLIEPIPGSGYNSRF